MSVQDDVVAASAALAPCLASIAALNADITRTTSRLQALQAQLVQAQAAADGYWTTIQQAVTQAAT